MVEKKVCYEQTIGRKLALLVDILKQRNLG